MKAPAPAGLAADRAAAMRLVNVSRETLERLDSLAELLLLWRAKMNLIAPSTVPQIWTRHIADSLQLLDLARDARIWIDLGSGAGFPGLPIACALAETAGAKVHLVESNAKKAAFLREAIRLTGAPALVHNQRIEKFVEHFDGRADAVTARALAPLKTLLNQSFALLKTGAVGLFPKGQDVEAELTEAAQYWNVNVNLKSSRTDPEGRIVLVRSIERHTRDR